MMMAQFVVEVTATSRYLCINYGGELGLICFKTL